MEPQDESPGRPLRADARRNRDHLLAVARQVFAEEGPEAPLEEIARRAEVGIGTLYRHFSTRLDLIGATYARQMEELIELARSLSERKPPGEALFSWLRTEAQQMLAFGALKAYLMSSGTGKEAAAHGWKQQLTAAVHQLLTEAQDAGAVRTGVDAEGVLRLVHGVLTATEGAPERGKQVSQLLDVVVDGLKGPPTGNT